MTPETKEHPSTAKRSQDKSHSLTRDIALLLIGAVVSFLSAFLGAYYQSRYNIQNLVIERQLTAVKDFSTVCAKNIQIGHRLLLLDAIRKRVSLEDPRLRERVLDQVQAVATDADAVAAEYQAQVNFVNAMFKADIPLPKDEPQDLPADVSSTASSSVESLKQSLPSARVGCVKFVQVLMEKIDR